MTTLQIIEAIGIYILSIPLLIVIWHWFIQQRYKGNEHDEEDI